MPFLKSLVACATALAFAANAGAQTPMYPSGKPCPKWQSFYEIMEPLPNVTFPLGRSFAGNLPINRGVDLSLFYWAVETKNGSLTSMHNDDAPWQIWLNGGPGSSSFLGFFFENGPIRINADYSASGNNYSWDKLADTVWIDQPVGVGYGTLLPNSSSNSGGYSGWAPDEDQMAIDFLEFLSNLVKVFPGLEKRPLHLMGESYAGRYIPYITKHYFGMTHPPVKLTKIAIGDGTIGNLVLSVQVPTVYVIETLPQVIGYDIEVFKYFQEQSHLCQFDINLTYPQVGKLPTVQLLQPNGQASTESLSWANYVEPFLEKVQRKYGHSQRKGLIKRGRDREDARRAWTRDLSQRPNGTIDPYYGCSIFYELLDYAVNYTYPWDAVRNIDVYNIPSALNPQTFEDASIFLNDPVVRGAVHAPNKTWQSSVLYYFGDTPNDPSPEPMIFLDELAANATAKNVSIIIYSGNMDSLVAHRGSEIIIQNTTFRGIQGFTRKPSTPWYDMEGNFAGVVHQERGWTYALFKAAGHLIPQQQPVTAYTFVREFVLGNNKTGLVTTSGVVGGEDNALAGDILPEGPDIYLGKYVTQSTYTYSSGTISQWSTFLANLTATTTLPSFTPVPTP